MAIKSLDHVNIRTSKSRETMNFYTEILDFSEGFRPPFNFPGAWLYAGESAVIHLVFDDSEQSDNYNPVDHIAFEAAGYEESMQRLESANWEYRCSDVPDRNIRQIFLVDPNGVKLELNFKE